MFDEYEFAICTLKKILFFNALRDIGITPETLINIISEKRGLSKEESTNLFYQKAVLYNSECNTIDDVMSYIFS